MDQLSSLGQQADTYVLVVAFLIGLGGSLHCVGMCGPLVSATSTNKIQSWFYQLGRLLGYLSLGSLVGLFGKIFIFQHSKTLNVIFSSLIALFFIVLGVKVFINKPFQFNMPKKIQSLWGKLKFKKPSIVKSGLTGMFSIFLPCGFLYAVIFATVSFQSFTLGVLSIITFWLGTLPAMTSAPYLVHKILRPLATKRPQLTGVFLISLGLLTIFWRYQASLNACHFCH